ncbi:MAG: hypothetical protein WBX38_01290 [Candidatus Sulfotelmatobacter sp.]
MSTATVTELCRKCGLSLNGPVCPSCGNVRQVPSLPTNGTLLRTNLRILLLVFLLAVTVFIYLEFTLANSIIYTDSIQRALASQDIQSLLAGC